MKTHILSLTLLFIVALTSFSFAEIQTVTLKDGSQIKGEVVGLVDGVYSVHSSTLGDIKLTAAEVASISSGAAPVAAAIPAPAANSGMNQRIQTAQERLMQDPAMMQKIAGLMEDPELMELLSDPALTQAVLSRDVKTIESNPRAQALMNHPKMRQLMEDMQDSGYAQ